MNTRGSIDWPISPQFPTPFIFPELGSDAWLGVSLWTYTRGDLKQLLAAERIRADGKVNWITAWNHIRHTNALPAEQFRWLKYASFSDQTASTKLQIGVGEPYDPNESALARSAHQRKARQSGKSNTLSFPELEEYSLSDTGKWVETLLDSQRFWDDINGWALNYVEKEGDELHSIESPPTAEEQCRRFHTYQQARFRYHQHLLETHCPRALGKDEHKNESAHGF